MKLILSYAALISTITLVGFSRGFMSSMLDMKYLLAIFPNDDIEKQGFHYKIIRLINSILVLFIKREKLIWMYKIDRGTHSGLNRAKKYFMKSVLFPYVILSLPFKEK